jgi:hypothetical protein
MSRGQATGSEAFRAPLKRSAVAAAWELRVWWVRGRLNARRVVDGAGPEQ